MESQEVNSFHQKNGLEFKDETVGSAASGTQRWTLREVDQKYLDSFKK
jgi:hypothetical protein